MQEAIHQRFTEWRKFLNGGIRNKEWMERKFTEHPALLDFPLEEVPALITKGVEESDLESINVAEIHASHHSLDGFSFHVPFTITVTDAVGSWGDVHTASGHLVFHIAYNKENRLSINASYNAIHLFVYNGVSFTVDDYEDTIVDYVAAICNQLKNVKKVK